MNPKVSMVPAMDGLGIGGSVETPFRRLAHLEHRRVWAFDYTPEGVCHEAV